MSKLRARKQSHVLELSQVRSQPETLPPPFGSSGPRPLHAPSLLRAHHRFCGQKQKVVLVHHLVCSALGPVGVSSTPASVASQFSSRTRIQRLYDEAMGRSYSATSPEPGVSMRRLWRRRISRNLERRKLSATYKSKNQVNRTALRFTSDSPRL